MNRYGNAFIVILLIIMLISGFLFFGMGSGNGNGSGGGSGQSTTDIFSPKKTVEPPKMDYSSIQINWDSKNESVETVKNKINKQANSETKVITIITKQMNVKVAMEDELTNFVDNNFPKAQIDWQEAK